jgi:hypothetical protein
VEKHSNHLGQRKPGKQREQEAREKIVCAGVVLLFSVLARRSERMGLILTRCLTL